MYRARMNGEEKLHPVAVVLAGAGARGAYEGGFIATLLPHLGTRPTIFVGTSAGAINAAVLASLADREPRDAEAEIIKRWKSIRPSMVLGSALKSVLGAGREYVHGEPPRGLLDTDPLREHLADPKLIDWAAIRRNLDSGKIHTLAFAATEMRSGRTKVFYDGKPENVQPNKARAIDYLKTPLSAKYVLASAAIPVAFPPVLLPTPLGDRHFIDGGVRLNVPLKPAISFGANAIVVISSDARLSSEEATGNDEEASAFSGALQIMRSMFADQMGEDLIHLTQRNENPAPTDRFIPFIFGGPTDGERVGKVARGSLARILAHWYSRFTRRDAWLINMLTKVSKSGPDLVSYLLFEPEFLSDAVDAGIEDAKKLLAANPTPEKLWNAWSASA